MNSINPGVSRAITLGSVILFGIFFAIFAGRALAQENYRIILLSGAAFFGISFFLMLGKNVYILLAASFTISGSIGILALPFSYQELIIFAAFGLTSMHVIFKKMNISTNSSPLNWIIWLNIIYLVTVYARNPVGVRALGSEMVGGRPYLTIFVAFLFFITLPQYKLPEKLAKWFPLILSTPTLILSSLATVAYFFPAMGGLIYPFWTGVGLGSATIEAAGGTAGPVSEIKRIPTLQIGTAIVLLLCSYFSVAAFITPLNFWYFVAFCFALVCWMASGFRSGFLVYGSYLAFNSYLRRRYADLLPAALVGILALSGLILAQGSGLSLPLGMQRALSFLPGDWDAQAASDAQGSTEWRIDMWKTVLTDNEFIKNKVLGDGFGFSAYDLKLQIDAILGTGGYLDGTKSQLITGAYHSGPLSAIRYVGFVGLLLYTILQFMCLWYSVKLVRRAWGTPYQALALYLSIPLFYLAFSFYIVFGGFDSDFPRMIMIAGLLKFLSNSLEGWRADQRKVAGTASTPMKEASSPELHARAV